MLFLLSILVFLAALVVNRNAESPVHQVYAAVGFLAAVVLLVGAAIVDALLDLPDRLVKRLRAANAPKAASTQPSEVPQPREPTLPSEPPLPREPTMGEYIQMPPRRK
jgi:hypothetical protein